jgi:hypothetical protein
MAPHGQSCLKGIVSFLGGCYRITQLSDLSVFFDKTRPASLRQSLQANWEPLITQTKTFRCVKFNICWAKVQFFGRDPTRVDYFGSA